MEDNLKNEDDLKWRRPQKLALPSKIIFAPLPFDNYLPLFFDYFSLLQPATEPEMIPGI